MLMVQVASKGSVCTVFTEVITVNLVSGCYQVNLTCNLRDKPFFETELLCPDIV